VSGFWQWWQEVEALITGDRSKLPVRWHASPGNSRATGVDWVDAFAADRGIRLYVGPHLRPIDLTRREAGQLYTALGAALWRYDAERTEQASVAMLHRLAACKLYVGTRSDAERAAQ
jgi:hypothetical protein